MALEEAGRRGCERAEAEHLLLAVAADSQNSGAIVLNRCGIDLDQLRIRVDKIAPTNGTSRPRAASVGPSILQVLDAAAAESARLRQGHVGTEHIAIALAKLDQLEVSRLLRGMGLNSAAAEEAIRRGFGERSRRWGGASRWPALLRPIQKIGRACSIAWYVYAKKSLGNPGYVSNPYPLYHWLHRNAPVRRDPLGSVWVLTRYDDVNAMLRDPRFRKDPFASDRLPRLVREQLGAPGDSIDAESVSMLFLDPPNHTRVRSAFARAFTPNSLASLRSRIEIVCCQRLDRVAMAGRMDLIADLAYPLPVIVIAELLGFPAEDYEKFKRWSDDMTEALALNATEAKREKAGQAREEIRVYFDGVVDRLPSQSNDSLISRLIELEDKTDGLNRDEIFINSVLLLAAGHETTTNLIGNGVLALMHHREQWEALVNDPSLIEPAVEEMLRFDSPVQWTSRVTSEPVEIGRQQIPAGEILLGCVGAANRDPDKFMDPDRFDIRRKENKHLSFGTGIHFCLGATLARMEAQIALAALVERFPKMRMAGGRLKWMKGLTFRGVTSLPLTLHD